MSGIALCDAAKRYRRSGPWVLLDVAVSVEPGTLVDVRGVNGSGKSTLLAMLAGAILPTRGHRVAPARLAVGYTPERLSPPPPFSAAEFLRHHSRLRDVRVADGERQAAALAERLAAGSLLGERLGALSKGSLQKVVLIQALLGFPGLLVLDEPFSGLDAAAARSLVALVRERVADGAAVVLTDHRAVSERTPAEVRWDVAGGLVRAHAPARDVAALAGVLGTRDGEDGRIRLRVAAGASDQVLTALLARAWHIESVEPGAPGETLIAAVPGL